MQKRGLTLIELLVVIGIIGILAAILYPVFAIAKKKARETKCITQLRQIGMAVQMYRSDTEDELPRVLSDLFPIYVTNEALFRCPLDARDGHHAYTGRLEGDRFLPSGVSYTYVPNWPKAIELGWWQAPPARGLGKWGEQTPLIECHWHWAKVYNLQLAEDDLSKAKGNAVIVRKDGSIRLWPARVSVERYEP